jgi:predicted RNA-binding Zn-ribbon protein involved in translation (DUF1610 family)
MSKMSNVVGWSVVDILDDANIRCPICGEQLIVSRTSSRMRALMRCSNAIGEITYDPDKRKGYLPTNAKHDRMTYYPLDQEILVQLLPEERRRIMTLIKPLVIMKSKGDKT